MLLSGPVACDARVADRDCPDQRLLRLNAVDQDVPGTSTLFRHTGKTVGQGSLQQTLDHAVKRVILANSGDPLSADWTPVHGGNPMDL